MNHSDLISMDPNYWPTIWKQFARIRQTICHYLGNDMPPICQQLTKKLPKLQHLAQLEIPEQLSSCLKTCLPNVWRHVNPMSTHTFETIGNLLQRILRLQDFQTNKYQEIKIENIPKCAWQILTLRKLTHLCTNFGLVCTMGGEGPNQFCLIQLHIGENRALHAGWPRAEKSAEAFRKQIFNVMCVPEVSNQLRYLSSY